MSHKNYIEKLFLEGQIKIAIEELLNGTKKNGQNSLYNDVILLKIRFNSNENNRMRGGITNDTYKVEDVNINESLQYYIEQYKPTKHEKIIEDYEKEYSKYTLEILIEKLHEVNKKIAELENSANEKKKILYITSAPEDLSQFKFQKETKVITEAHRTNEKAKENYLEPKFRLDVLAKHLKKLIREKPVPQVVHISLHGRKDEGLVFGDENGKENIIDEDTFADWFKNLKDENINIECVLINACHSTEICKAISPYVDYAIGMDNKILDKSAICFAEGFYDQLFATNDYEKAFIEGIDYIAGAVKVDSEGIVQRKIPQLYKNGNQ